ncbi:MAG: hypothetical protein ACP5RE_03425 [Candidatus Acidifodinimicrobium sp.]
MQPWTGSSRNHTLTIKQTGRNLQITRKRSPGERPYSAMRRIINRGHTLVTMVRRYRVRAMFLCLGYNLVTLLMLKKHGMIE